MALAVGSILARVSGKRIDGWRDSNNDTEEDLQRRPESVACLGSRVSAPDDPQDADADEEDSNAEEEQDPESLHRWDLGCNDEREWDDHEKQVGYDIADFIRVNPDTANDAAWVSACDLRIHDGSWHTNHLDQD